MVFSNRLISSWTSCCSVFSFAMVFQLFCSWNFVLEGVCHCLLAIQQPSVIEEKGEGFENGKILLACLV
jgi:hypothetical protein